VLHIHKSSIFPSKAHTSVIVKIYIKNQAVNKSKHVGFCVKIDIMVKQYVCSGNKIDHYPDYNSSSLGATTSFFECFGLLNI
jgi:hypothetical protein